MGSRLKRRVSAKNSGSNLKFDDQFSLWLDMTAQLEAPYPASIDAFAHEAAMDLVYDKKKAIETWLCYHFPTSAFETFCLVEIVRRHDEEMPERVLEALQNAQSWLAQRVLTDYQQAATLTGKILMDRTLKLTSIFRVATQTSS